MNDVCKGILSLDRSPDPSQLNKTVLLSRVELGRVWSLLELNKTIFRNSEHFIILTIQLSWVVRYKITDTELQFLSDVVGRN